MIKKNLVSTFVVVCMVLGGCSSQSCLQSRTERLIKKHLKETDTVFLYSFTCSNYNIVWYHRGNHILGFKVKPHHIERYKPIEAKNIGLINESIDNYFGNYIYKDIPCFESVLDGAWIKLYFSEKNPLFSSIDMGCLFNNSFSTNSFPYKLQYDFSKLGICPPDFKFEEMYPEQ